MSPGRIADRNGLNIGGVSVPYGILLLIAGGALAVIAFFVGWVSVATPAGTSGPTGLSLLTEGVPSLGIGADGIGFAGWLPLLSFMFAILCIAAGMLGISRRGKATAAVQAVLGAGAFVCAMAFTYVGGGGGLFTGAAAEIADAMIAGEILAVTVSIGNFMAMTGGLLALIGGGLELREMFDLGE